MCQHQPSEGKEASKAWVADTAKEVLKATLDLRAKNWIKEIKGFPVDVLIDTIRAMIMEKIAMRHHIANKLEGTILPSVINELKMKSRNLKYTIKGSGGLKADVSGLTKDNYPWRHAVDLESKTCSCGQWHISGKPYTHVIAFIGSLRQIKLDDYVHDY